MTRPRSLVPVSRQPVDFMDEVVHKDAVGHDGLTVAGAAEVFSLSRVWFGLPVV